MLTRVEIDGFKSFRRFALDLGPLQAIVGPNSAGKSNLFDALQLLSRLAGTNVYGALRQGRGRVQDQFTRERGGAATRIQLAAELLVPTLEPANRLRYEVSLVRKERPSGVEDLQVEDERLLVLAEHEDRWVVQHPRLRQLARYAGSGLVYSTGWGFGIGRPGEPVETEPAVNLYGRHFVMLLPGQTFLSHGHDDPAVDAVCREFASWRFLHLDAARLRAPSERAASAALAPDGANLPTVLAALPGDTFAQVQADLSGLIPGVRGLFVVPQDDEFHIEVEFNDDLRLPARVLSDGTLRLLGFLVLLRTASPGAVIGMEEPENGIYPGRLRAFLDKLRQASTDGANAPTQILLNSHSPTVLAALRDQPSLLLFADLLRGQDGLKRTRVRPVSNGKVTDHGATEVSIREIDRLLQTAHPPDASEEP